MNEMPGSVSRQLLQMQWKQCGLQTLPYHEKAKISI